MLIEIDPKTFEFRNGDIFIDRDDSSWEYWDGRVRSCWSITQRYGAMLDGWLTPVELNRKNYGPFKLIFRK